MQALEFPGAQLCDLYARVHFEGSDKRSVRDYMVHKPDSLKPAEQAPIEAQISAWKALAARSKKTS